MVKGGTKWFKFLVGGHAKNRVYLIIPIAVMLPLVYVLVYLTGGSRFVYVHTAYIPIILAAIVFGIKGGVVVGVLAGLLYGPLMPLNTETGEMQPLMNWLYRLIFFVFIGSVVGIATDFMRLQYRRLKVSVTHDDASGLPKVEANPVMFGAKKKIYGFNAVTVLVNNYEQLVILVGSDAYQKVIKDIYQTISECFDAPVTAHIDAQRLWFMVKTDVFKARFNDFFEYIDTHTFEVNDVPLYVDVSVGVYEGTEHDTSCLQAFHASELSAFHAKKQGLKYAFYHEDFHRESVNLKRLGAVKNAILNQELYLVYHPIIRLKDDQAVALEALVRWNDNGRTVEPDNFIPMVENTRLIDPLTEWVLSQVINDYKTIEENQSNMAVNVNISQRNLYNPELIKKLLAKIKRENYKGKVITVEITESALMLNRKASGELLEELTRHNIAVAIDDFGQGYSSLSTLISLPIETIKIARELVFEIARNERAASIVKMIIDYAHEMGMRVIAEGIETQATLDKLKSFGCDYGQGFYYTIPQPLNAITSWLNNRVGDK